MKTKTAPAASGPNMGALLTVAELLDEIKRLGLDPTLVTFSVDGEPVVARSDVWRIAGYNVDFDGGWD